MFHVMRRVNETRNGVLIHSESVATRNNRASAEKRMAELMALCPADEFEIIDTLDYDRL